MTIGHVVQRDDLDAFLIDESNCARVETYAVDAWAKLMRRMYLMWLASETAIAGAPFSFTMLTVLLSESSVRLVSERLFDVAEEYNRPCGLLERAMIRINGDRVVIASIPRRHGDDVEIRLYATAPETPLRVLALVQIDDQPKQ